MPNLVIVLWKSVLQYSFFSGENIYHSDEEKQAADPEKLDRVGSPSQLCPTVSPPCPTVSPPCPAVSPPPLNPIAQTFRDLDLGKVMIGVVVAVVGAFLTQHAPTSLALRVLIISCASLGFSTIWIGMMLRGRRHAVGIEQLGSAMVLLAFFGLVSSLLPGYYQWAPWGCFLITLLPFYLQLFS